ncbi:MAG TPA: VWA domain-containing protein [Thermoanaerobaculia bacterium]|nr:VWA domain-containing protein [Thermoanaerobaculia bacterium]
MITKRVLVPFLLFSSLSIPLFAPHGLRAGDGPDRSRLRSWIEKVSLLITPREKEAFLELPDDSSRQAFIKRFWEARDPHPETPRNEMEEVWEARLGEAEKRWGDVRDDRAQVFLLQGEPSLSFETRCGGATYEVWSYKPRFQVKYGTVLVFEKGRDGHAHLWRPAPGGPRVPVSAQECADSQKMAQVTKWIQILGEGGYEAVLERTLSRPQVREWLSSFKPVSLGVPSGVETLPADLRVEYPGREDGRSLARVLIALPPGSVPETGARDLLLVGELRRGDSLIEAFRYRFEAEPRPEGCALAFERPLPPGPSSLRVKLEHPASRRAFVAEKEIVVPEAPVEVASVAGPTAAAGEPAAAPDAARFFAEADASLRGTRPALRLIPPPGRLVAGSVRFEARADGGAGVPEEDRIERVAFSLDGKPLLTRTRPPFLLEVDLGQAPRVRKLEAQGLNRAGEVVAKDELVLNGAAQELAVRLTEPRPGRIYRQSLRLRADVKAPADRPVERVELYVGERRVATLYQPPFSQPVALRAGEEAAYVRAVAFLADGSSAEDLVLLNAPNQPDRIDVRVVELYATVADAAGRPVQGIDPAIFQIFEDGIKQKVRVADQVADTPVRIVTLIDNSASMAPRMAATRGAALEFLRHTLRPQDQAAVISFNRSPRIAVGLTGNLQALEEGLSGLVAQSDTALYDSLIYSLYYLTGVKGQRAVLVLSDGLDQASDFRFEDALECARRAGLAVYSIGLDLPDGARGEAARRLARLSAETGGRSFFVQGTQSLPAVYDEIERDLRSQYRIVYQSSNSKADEAFRAVRVDVGKAGLAARTISGYYP